MYVYKKINVQHGGEKNPHNQDFVISVSVSKSAGVSIAHQQKCVWCRIVSVETET